MSDDSLLHVYTRLARVWEGEYEENRYKYYAAQISHKYYAAQISHSWKETDDHKGSVLCMNPSSKNIMMAPIKYICEVCGLVADANKSVMSEIHCEDMVVESIMGS